MSLKHFFWFLPVALLLPACILRSSSPSGPDARTGGPLSPCAIVASPDGNTLYVAMATGRCVKSMDRESGKVLRTLSLPCSPTGLALAADGSRLYATTSGHPGKVLVVNPSLLKEEASLTLGHTPTSPVLSQDGKSLYVCNRYNDDVSVVNLQEMKEECRIKVLRQPVAAALTKEGLLLVANHLPMGPSDVDVVSASISIIDPVKKERIKDIQLPNGSSDLRGISVSPDGRTAYVTHLLSRFHVPTTQLERGWMNTAGLSLIDLQKLELLNTVLLDDVDDGAANPWGVASSADGQVIVVTLAGRHEISVINAQALLDKLAKLQAGPDPSQPVDPYAVSLTPEDVPNDLSFLARIRERIHLNGNGPRSLVVLGDQVYVPEYFTDTLDVVDLKASPYRRLTTFPLGPEPVPSATRKGEILFNDAGMCFQGWQSCASCHPDSRTDGLNWDLLNDGMGTPKNTKSMLLAHKTPPAMSQGVRESAEMAVRAGIKFIQFVVRPEEDAAAIDEYLKSLEPIPSPWLVNGHLSEAAERGKKLFLDDQVGCARCHSGPYFTDLQLYDVGTRGPYDQTDAFDTPGLVETWLTAPYLHDGRSVSMQDVLIKDNAQDKHGTTSHLTPQEIDDLATYVLSL